MNLTTYSKYHHQTSVLNPQYAMKSTHITIITPNPPPPPIPPPPGVMQVAGTDDKEMYKEMLEAFDVMNFSKDEVVGWLSLI